MENQNGVPETSYHNKYMLSSKQSGIRSALVKNYVGVEKVHCESVTMKYMYLKCIVLRKQLKKYIYLVSFVLWLQVLRH